MTRKEGLSEETSLQLSLLYNLLCNFSIICNPCNSLCVVKTFSINFGSFSDINVVQYTVSSLNGYHLLYYVHSGVILYFPINLQCILFLLFCTATTGKSCRLGGTSLLRCFPTPK